MTFPKPTRHCWFLLPLLWLVTPCAALELVRGGEASLPIVLARDAIPAELTAARELAHYLAAATGARFVIEIEGEGQAEQPAILIGPTAAATRAEGDLSDLGPEEWVIRVEARQLLLYGGRPRGTLYAVYRFLEEQLGVRWWTPFETSVPRRRGIRVSELAARGSPFFVYRDAFGIDGPPEFRARHRLNGHYSRLTRLYGGSERFGPPKAVHNVYQYLPPEEHFERNPELFSKLGGVRYAKRGQLCLTHPDLPRLVRERLVSYIEQARAEARRLGEAEPELFSFSLNDWGGMCRCERCTSAEARYASAAGSLVELINRLADSIREEYPGVRLDTLAYLGTLSPPVDVRLRDNVVVRLSALQQRDFSLPLTDPSHDKIRAAIEGWLEVTPHLRIWDYAVSYSRTGDLPLPNIAVLADDLRYYRELGIEGVFVQHDFPLSADLRALKQWVLLELIRDPGQDSTALVEEFARGYYGAAGRSIRRYVEALQRQAAEHPAPIRYEASADDYAYLDAAFLIEAQRLFDQAERKVARDPVLRRRVRRARLSLDRATLWRWLVVFGDDRGAAAGLDWAAVVRRYRETWYTQIGLRMPDYGRAASRAELEREIAFLEARFED